MGSSGFTSGLALLLEYFMVSWCNAFGEINHQKLCRKSCQQLRWCASRRSTWWGWKRAPDFMCYGRAWLKVSSSSEDIFIWSTCKAQRKFLDDQKHKKSNNWVVHEERVNTITFRSQKPMNVKRRVMLSHCLLISFNTFFKCTVLSQTPRKQETL